uniref:Uncharacterized protein n=1 Tax=Graphocephala atropunctata TaxID=36148 RepID=A0A1B6KYZ3_9HEMI
MSSDGGNGPSLERLFKGHKGKITSLTFNSDTTQLVSSSTDTSLMLWNFKKEARAYKYEKHTDSVTGVHFATSKKLLASCSKDRSVRLWKLSIKPNSKDFRAHTSSVSSVQFSSDSSTLLTASNDKSIKIWMTEHHNKFLATFQGHTNWVNCARFSHTDQLIVSCSEDKTVKIWDKLSGCCTHTFQEPGGVPKYVEFHPSDKCVAVCLSDSTIKIYDIRKHDMHQYYPTHTEAVNQISFHPNGKFMISGSSDKTVKVYDLMEGRVIYTLEGHEGPVTAVTFSGDGHAFASGGEDKMVLIWKSNFDQEVLAHPLDTSSKIQETECRKEKDPTKVDVRTEFLGMVQPDIEVSSIGNMNSDSSDDGKNPIAERSSTLSSVNSNSEETSLQDKDVDDGLNMAKIILASLKLEVQNLQRQLTGVIDKIDDLEKITERVGPQ